MDFANAKAAFVSNIRTGSFLKRIDPVVLLRGLAVVALFYMLLWLYATWTAENTLKNLESKMASISVPLGQVTTTPPDSLEHASESTSQHAGNENKGAHQKASGQKNNALQTIDGLTEETRYGTLPVIRQKDNLTSFRAYQHPFSFAGKPLSEKPIIAFIIKDFGLSKDASETALDILPAPVSLMLSPYAGLPKEWMTMAQNKGHEVWMHTPIQHQNAVDFGPSTLFHHTGYNEKLGTLYQTLSQTRGYCGISSYTDESLSLAEDQYKKLTEEIYSRGLGYFEINPDAPPIIERKALAFGAPYIQADLEILRMQGEHSFETLESIARQNGHAVAVIPAYPKLIKNLAVWIMKVAQADYIVAPISAMYDLPLARAQASQGSQRPKALETSDHSEPEEQ